MRCGVSTNTGVKDVTNQQRFLVELADLLKVKCLDEGVINSIMHAAERVYTQEIPPCLAKADQAEPVFILRGQDQSASDVVRYWVAKNQQINSKKQRAAMQVSDAMVEWPKRKKAD